MEKNDCMHKFGPVPLFIFLKSVDRVCLYGPVQLFETQEYLEVFSKKISTAFNLVLYLE